MKIPFKKLNDQAKLPARATPDSAGCDVYACISESVEILPGQTSLIPTGFAIAIPAGYGGFLFARSGLGINNGIVPGNCVGVIDSDYRGEVVVGLHNHSQTAYIVKPQERIAQLIILPVPKWEAEEEKNLEGTLRGCKGFGSTGRE